MLFTQIIAFILVLVVYESYRPAPPDLSLAGSLLASAAAAAWLWVGCRMVVSRFLARLAGPRPPASPSRSGRRLLLYMQAAAVGCALAIFTLLDLKAHMIQVPALAASETLSGLCALLVYAFLLSLTWAASHPLERAVFGQAAGRWEYVLGQIRFVAPVVFPWLAVSLASDAVSLLVPGGDAWLESYTGDFVFLCAFLALMAVFFPVLVRVWWGCRPWPRDQVRDLAQSVLKAAGVRVGAILTWPVMQGRLLTAGILGVVPRFSYLLLTPAIVESLSPRELAGVVAHEAGHVRHRHLLSYLLFFMGFFLAAYAITEPMGILLNQALIRLAATDWGYGMITGGGQSSALFSLALALPLVAFLVLYLRFVMGFFMRNFERQADFFGLRLLGEAAPLAGALEKVALFTGGSRDVPSWHHFSVAQRVEALMAAERDPGVIVRHRLRLRRGLVLYLAGLALLGGVGLWAGLAHPGRELERGLVIEVLQRQVARNPRDAGARLNLGVLQFEHGDELRARRNLEIAAALAPNSAETLNGLAWLLATARDRRLRNAPRALALAQRAVRINPAPHIWDTLAEAYHVNGMDQRALAAARAALAAGPAQRRDYYQRQLERFARAAGEKP